MMHSFAHRKHGLDGYILCFQFCKVFLYVTDLSTQTFICRSIAVKCPLLCLACNSRLYCVLQVTHNIAVSRRMRDMNEEGVEKDAKPNVPLPQLVDPNQLVHSVIDISFVKHRWSEGRRKDENTGYAMSHFSSQRDTVRTPRT